MLVGKTRSNTYGNGGDEKMTLSKSERVYFHGLDELRAVAALLVYLHHSENYKCTEKLPSLFDYTFFSDFIEKLGRNSVIAFFTLSGFLITYLLLVEKERTGTISVKAFYVRRILRIWPLYFLTVFIGFALVPLLHKTGLFNNQPHFSKLVENLNYNSLPLFILFLSNFALKYFKPVFGAAQSWSVSVEEQFYLVWPHVIKYCKGIKKILLVVILLLIFKVGIQDFISSFYGKNNLYRMLNLVSVEFMFVGAIAALFVFSRKKNVVTDWILKSRVMLILTLLAIAYELFTYNHFLIVSTLVSLLILLLITQKIEIKFLKYFGKISYGIYMLHPLMLYLAFSLTYGIKNITVFNVCFYSLSFALTVLFAGLSYRYIENPILIRKKKYTIIKSGSK